MRPAFQKPRGLAAAVWGCSAAMFAGALVNLNALALDPSHKLTQYGHTVWRTQDGVFGGVPTAIAQTKDGYIWIGTQAGLMRFDGVRFTAFHASAKERLRSPVISSLLAANDGSLWIGTTSYLAHFKDGDLTNYTDTRGSITGLKQARDGAIWFSRTRSGDDKGGLCRVIGPKARCYGGSDGMPVRYARFLEEGQSGDWWVCGGNTVADWNGTSSKTYSVASLKPVDGLVGITSLAKAADGSLWAGMGWQGKGLGLQHIVDGKFVPFVAPSLNSSHLEVGAMLFDRDHSLWIGTDREGIYRINGDTVDHFGAADGLSSDLVEGFFEDKEGNIWATTSKGIDKFRETKVISYSKTEGLPFDRVESVLAARDGTVWAGDVWLTSIGGSSISSMNFQTGLPGHLVTSFLEDQMGKLWIGVDDKLFVRDHSKFQEIRRADGHAVGAIENIAGDPDGSVWASPTTLPHELLHIVNYKVVEAAQPPHGLRPYAFAPEANGNLLVSLQGGDLAQYHAAHWTVIPMHRPAGGIVQQFSTGTGGRLVGATSSGVLGWSNGHVQYLDTDNDLPCSRVHSLVFDKQRALWLYTACGLVQIADSELERWWQNPKVKIKLRTFDTLDGAQPAPADFQPSASLAPDGKLWFANGTVLQRIDPLHLSRNAWIPPVHIEEVIADKKEYSTQKTLSLPPLTRELQINYTALSFVIPQRVQFRYKLEGFEGEWQNAGSRRQAFYTNLRPGAYQFHVIACNDDGVWNEVGDAVRFSIAPAYYQTRWFGLLCVAIFAAMLWMLYLFRLRQATAKIQERLGARMEERQRIARELHDTLLQGFQGLMLRFQAVMKTLPAETEARRMMEEVLDRADEVLLEGRQSVKDLRDERTSEGDFAEAVRRCGEELARDYPTQLSVTIVGEAKPLAPVVFDEAYRIAREALINAFQHSQARKIEVEMTYAETAVSLRIRDDGTGIDATTLATGRAGHWGLSGMRERAHKICAEVEIWSQVGAGTEIELTIPSDAVYSQAKRGSLWRRIKYALMRTREEQL